jgi:hypothetical protein
VATKLERAVKGLYDEIKKLDPEPRAALEGHLLTIRQELAAQLGTIVTGTVSSPFWVTAPSRRRRRKR